ncbi:hypothetical protein ACX1C1_02905 [Paenibacillus sp. strain BS8-2]
MRRKKRSRFISPILSGAHREKAAQACATVQSATRQEAALHTSLSINLDFFQQTFQNCSNMVYREFSLGEEQTVRAAIIGDRDMYLPLPSAHSAYPEGSQGMQAA